MSLSSATSPPGSFSDRDRNKPYRSQRLVPLFLRTEGTEVNITRPIGWTAYESSVPWGGTANNVMGVAKLNGASYTVHFVENQRNELCWMYRLGPAPNRTTPPRTKKPAAGRKPGDRLRAVSAYCSSGRTTVEPEPAPPEVTTLSSTPGHLPAAMSSFLRSIQKSAFLMPSASGSKCGSMPAFFWRR